MLEPILLVAVFVLGSIAAIAVWLVRRRSAELSAARAPLRVEPGQDLTRSAEQLVTAHPAGPPKSEDLVAAADMVGIGIVRLDDDLVIRLANAAARRMFGRSTSLVGQTAIEAFTDHRIEGLLDRTRSAGSASAELVLREPDQPTVRLLARRTVDDSTWLVLEDVSEIRRLQRIRSEFIDNLSHELRTPLTTVSLLVETLARESADQVPPRMHERILKIEVETDHLVQMVNELLDLSRIESGQQPPRMEVVDLVPLVRQTVERLRTFAERAGVRLAMKVEGSIPPVRGDEERLGQVVINLLHNAIKFSPPGSEVVVGVRAAPPEVVVAVTDHGIGIPKGDQARIFERFFKVDRARARGGGTGLGLAIARHAVEAHGGRIWVESEERAGSTFSFALPAVPSQAGPGTP